MHDLRLTAMRVSECGQHVAHDRDLLVEGERQRPLRDVLSQGVTGHVLRDQHEPTLVLVRKEVPNRQDVRVTGQCRHRPEGVLDASPFGLSLRIGEVRIDRVHPQPRTADLPGAEKGMAGAVLRVSIGAAQPFLDLPVAIARRGVPRSGAPDDGSLNLPQTRPDVGGSAGRDAFRGLEERGALREVGDRRCVPAAGVLHVGVGCSHQHRGVGVHAPQGPVGRILVANQRLQRLRVAAKDRQRGVIRRAPLRVPLAAVDIHEAARALHVDQVHAVRAEQRDVDLEDVASLPELEVVDDGEAVRQMVAEVGDRLALGVVDGLADGEDLGHQVAPCRSIQCSTRERASRSR